MHNHRLWGLGFESPAEVVGWLGAMQAQEFQYAKWSVAQRARAIDDAVMNYEIAAGRILRTHILRPTWHFVLPADIRWMLELSAPRVNALSAYQYRKLELDDKVFAKSNRLLAKHLNGGVQLTRKEIAGVLSRAGIVADGLRLGYILMRAELDAVVCSGAPRGKQQTYARLDERAPEARRKDQEEGLAELTRRFFTSRGPATLKDFLTWSSFTATQGKAGLDSIASELEHETVGGRTYWSAPSVAPPEPEGPRVDLVQGYDECIMSYKESRDVLWEGTAAATSPRNEAVFTHAILLDGRLLGHWRRVPEKASVAIEAWTYRGLERAEERALGEAAGRYERFLGAPVTLRRAESARE
jgi:winged helix DNA-binding protein